MSSYPKLDEQLVDVLDYEELMEELANRNLSTDGTTPELVQRLKAALRAEQDASLDDTDRVSSEIEKIPNVGNDMKGNNCHQCHKSSRARTVSCSKCKSKHFCIKCLEKWYPELREKEVATSCPVCRNMCNCARCLRIKRSLEKPNECNNEEIVARARFVLDTLIPFVEEMKDQADGVCFAAHSREPLPIKLKPEANKKSCDYCKDHILDLHRTCADCSYDLCLKCCKDIQENALDGWHVTETIRCPPHAIGGCGRQNLTLRYIEEEFWMEELLDKAKESCTGEAREQPRARVHKKISADDVNEFKKQWPECTAISLTNVQEKLQLSWAPLVLLRGLKGLKTIMVENCSKHETEHISIHKFFKDFVDGKFSLTGWPINLSWEDWAMDQDVLPSHATVLLNTLPMKAYCHPNGVCNLLSQYDDALKIYYPKLYIAYGFPSELGEGDSVKYLNFEETDTMYMLMHINEVKMSIAQLKAIVKAGANINVKDFSYPEEGVSWEVYHSGDLDVLEKYVATKNVDLNKIFLNKKDKHILRRDHGIEPICFTQKLGEAVLIPAGQPYQFTNMKVVVRFISMQSVKETMRVTESPSHILLKKFGSLQVNKMIIDAFQAALSNIEHHSNENFEPLP